MVARRDAELHEPGGDLADRGAELRVGDRIAPGRRERRSRAEPLGGVERDPRDRRVLCRDGGHGCAPVQVWRCCHAARPGGRVIGCPAQAWFGLSARSWRETRALPGTARLVRPRLTSGGSAPVASAQAWSPVGTAPGGRCERSIVQLPGEHRAARRRAAGSRRFAPPHGLIRPDAGMQPAGPLWRPRSPDHPDGAMRARTPPGGVTAMSLPWPVRSVVAGAAGTTALTLAYSAERRLRKTHRGQLDYDDSLVPGKIVASVMHLPHVTDREDHELGVALRWSYGSAFGLMHGLLHRSVREPWASAAFGGMLMSATLTLFPLLGRTPPPWRWPADVLATSLGTHAAYVTAVAVVDDAVRRARDSASRAGRGNRRACPVAPDVGASAGPARARRSPSRRDGRRRARAQPALGSPAHPACCCRPVGRRRRCTRVLRAHARAGHLPPGTATVLQLDEYAGLGPSDPRSFAAQLRAQLEGIPLGAIRDARRRRARPGGRGGAPRRRPRGGADRPRRARAGARRSRRVRRAAGADGVGRGRGRRSPGDRGRTRRRRSAALEHVPARGAETGLGTLYRARELILLVSGAAKAPALRAMLEDPVEPRSPASLLRDHPRLTIDLRPRGGVPAHAPAGVLQRPRARRARPPGSRRERRAPDLRGVARPAAPRAATGRAAGPCGRWCSRATPRPEGCRRPSR